MYPRQEGQVDRRIVDDILLQAYGVVSAAEISNPEHLDTNVHQRSAVPDRGQERRYHRHHGWLRQRARVRQAHVPGAWHHQAGLTRDRRGVLRQGTRHVL